MTRRGPSDLMARARAVIPGGVNSPIRSFAAVGGEPIALHTGRGALVVDADGREYVDFVAAWGPQILGHAHEDVVAAITRAARHGTGFGAPHAAEVELAELIVAAYPAIDQVRFVASGTEAAMTAVRLARGATGRDEVVTFAGCYHGHADPFLVAAGSGMATLGTPASGGVPQAVAGLTHVVPLDDEQRVVDLFRRRADRIAALIIEPVPANHGLLLQRPEFLRTLRRLTRDHGSLLIFDEVVSGFRVGRGGAAEHYRIEPDLACFGKVIGGGLPIGALAGSRGLMRQLAPEGSVYQAGTMAGNPLAMAAGVATLQELERNEGWERLATIGARLDEVVRPVLAAAPVAATLVRLGSIFWLTFQSRAPRAAARVDDDAAGTFAGVFHRLLRDGIYYPPSAFEVGFLSTAHRGADLEAFAAALSSALHEA